MLMMEVATSAVRDDDVIILSNLRVNLERHSEGRHIAKHSLRTGKLQNLLPMRATY